MTKSIIQRIVEVKSRTDSNYTYPQIDRLESLLTEFNHLKETNANLELFKYFPIATVASFESYFQLVVSDLIDFGEPYKQNAVKFKEKNIKFDFEAVLAIDKKTVSVGEFIAHLLSCNKLADINYNMETVLGRDFLKSLKSFSPTKPLSYLSYTEKFLESPEEVIADVEATFEMRHIFCHEFASQYKVDKEKINKCLKSCLIFLAHTQNFIENLLDPDKPATLPEIFEEAENELFKTSQQLEAIIKRTIEVSSSFNNLRFNELLFNDVILKWRNYADSYAEYLAFCYSAYGSLHPLLKNWHLTRCTDLLVKELCDVLETFEKQDSSE